MAISHLEQFVWMREDICYAKKQRCKKVWKAEWKRNMCDNKWFLVAVINCMSWGEMGEKFPLEGLEGHVSVSWFMTARASCMKPAARQKASTAALANRFWWINFRLKLHFHYGFHAIARAHICESRDRVQLNHFLFSIQSVISLLKYFWRELKCLLDVSLMNRVRGGFGRHRRSQIHQPERKLWAACTHVPINHLSWCLSRSPGRDGGGKTASRLLTKAKKSPIMHTRATCFRAPVQHFGAL